MDVKKKYKKIKKNKNFAFALLFIYLFLYCFLSANILFVVKKIKINPKFIKEDECFAYPLHCYIYKILVNSLRVTRVNEFPYLVVNNKIIIIIIKVIMNQVLNDDTTTHQFEFDDTSLELRKK